MLNAVVVCMYMYVVIVTVCLSGPDASSYSADVVSATKPGSVYDLAVLKLRHFRPRSQWLNRLPISCPVEGHFCHLLVMDCVNSEFCVVTLMYFI